MKTEPQNPQGLVISATETIRSFLSGASKDPHLSPELQQIAFDLTSQCNVPYKSLRALWFASQPYTRPALIQLLSGSEFVFTSPKPREKVIRFSINVVWLLRNSPLRFGIKWYHMRKEFDYGYRFSYIFSAIEMEREFLLGCCLAEKT